MSLVPRRVSFELTRGIYLSWMNLIHTLITCLFKKHFLITLSIDFRVSVHHSIIHTEIANKMQQRVKIYYSMFT
jgi:hypothetical protein